jgi:hypothetical protein
MNIEQGEKAAFVLLGKLKFVHDGSGVRDVWQEANCHVGEIFPLANKDATGKPVGIWGAMSDQGMHFLPWEKNFSQGFYLAGMECPDDVVAPPGWTKWTVPGFRYVYVKVEDAYQVVMNTVLHEYFKTHGLHLVGAIQEYYCPQENGQLYLFFPIEKR